MCSFPGARMKFTCNCIYVSQWLWETGVLSPMSDSEIKITAWLSANSNPGPSGFQATSIALSASCQGRENQGPKGNIYI